MLFRACYLCKAWLWVLQGRWIHGPWLCSPPWILEPHIQQMLHDLSNYFQKLSSMDIVYVKHSWYLASWFEVFLPFYILSEVSFHLCIYYSISVSVAENVTKVCKMLQLMQYNKNLKKLLMPEILFLFEAICCSGISLNTFFPNIIKGISVMTIIPMTKECHPPSGYQF